MSDKGIEVQDEPGLFSEPDDHPGFRCLLLNLNGDDKKKQTEDRYRRMDMVVDSGAFVSGMPPAYYLEYPIDQVDRGQIEGGTSASGETLPI